MNIDVEKLTNADLSDALYDWNCMMAYGFNGTPYPKDFPRRESLVYSYQLNGKHLAYPEFKKYCTQRGITDEF